MKNKADLQRKKKQDYINQKRVKMGLKRENIPQDSELLTNAEFNKRSFKICCASGFFDKDFKSDERVKMLNAFKREVKRLSSVAK